MAKTWKVGSALFEELEKEGQSHFMRSIRYDGKRHVMSVGFSISDSASLLKGNGGAMPATLH